VATTDEHRYKQCLREIALKGGRIDELEVDLAVLRSTLAAFEAACHARIGDLLAELRRLAISAADYDHRLQRLRADEAAIEDDEPPPFSQRRPDGAADPTEPAPPDPDLDPANGARAAFRQWPAAAEAKRLYLDLAKRCHPDRAQDDADRLRREALMLRINEAWRHRDLETLKGLRQEAERADPTFRERPIADRLAWATAELSRLDDLQIDLRAELILLRRGETHRLWRRHEAGEPVIDQIERDFESRLRREGRRLDALIAAYRRLRDERRRAQTRRRRPPHPRPPPIEPAVDRCVGRASRLCRRQDRGEWFHPSQWHRRCRGS